MNYLAHILLSGPDATCKVGGFIADFVKGNRLEAYPPAMQQGIRLHRSIDTFTDSHPEVKKAKDLLRPDYGLYSGVFLDIYYDHFLATHWASYSEESLLQFTRNFCFDLIGHYSYLPSKVKGFVWHFIFTNRLYQYSKLSGIERVFQIMETHRNLPCNSTKAMAILKHYHEALYTGFTRFFPDLDTFVQEQSYRSY